MRQKMTLPQISSLLVHSDDPERKVVPQLHGVAAWLASMDPRVFEAVLKTDPDMLVLSDVQLSNESSQEALAESFLTVFGERKIQHPGFVPHRLYRKLAHPGLAAQLRPLIHDPARSIVSRQAAIDIATACEVKGLQDDLAEIALDQAQPVQLRVPAAFAVARFGDRAVRSRMMPLAAGQAGEDPDDELKGCGLRAVWPDHITASELLAFLTPPKRGNLYGAYRAFLREGLVEHLKPQDFPLALRWIREQVPLGVFSDRFEGLGDRVMLRAWEGFDLAEVSQPFAEVAAVRLGAVYGINGEGLEEAIGKEESKRRSLMRAILPLYKDTSDAVACLLFGRTPVVRSGDVIWMIEELRACESEKGKSLWARLIFHLFDRRDAQQVDAIVAASEQEPMLGAEFSPLLRPVALDSPQAQELKDEYLEAKKREAARGRSRPLVVPSPQQRMAALLDAFESGDTSAWWRLNLEMTLEPDSEYYGQDGELTITELPGWKAANETTRTGIVAAAKRYLTLADPEAQVWLGTNTWHRPAVAGYRALKLLLAEQPAFVESISPNVWAKWAPTILAYFPDVEPEADDLDLELLKRAYGFSPEPVVETLINLIDKENKGGSYIFTTRRVQCCWDEGLAAALAAKLRDETLSPTAMNCLLADLLDHGVPEAREYAESLLPLSCMGEGDQRLRSVLAAATLLTHTEDGAWGSVWPAVLRYEDFGREVLSRIASEHHLGGNIGQRLKEDQLGELYVWLARHYPYAEDPKFEGVHGVGPREMLGDFRDGILAHLKSRGTNKACEVIQWVARELPGLDWLGWTLAEARAITRQRTWVPPKPQDIIKLAGDPVKRLVEGGEQLLQVLIESLERLQEKLLGETPRSRFLWNQSPDGRWRPKEEDSLSDYVKNHFDDDLRSRGIILGREVQIRRRAGEKAGEEPDIYVEAVRRNGQGEAFDFVSAVIEVKGCWHEELNTAMKAQLAERYLKDSQCRHGLYVVGWFNCNSWDQNDARRGRAPDWTVAEARQHFDSQASNLSHDDLLIRAFLIDVGLR